MLFIRSTVYIFVFTLILFNSIIYSQVTDPEVNIVYIVDEILFEYKDHESLTESQLKSILATSTGRTYRSSVLGTDMKRLKKFYFDNGFFDAIIDTSVEYLQPEEEANEANAIVHIIIYERDHYIVSEIDLQGLNALSEDLKRQVSTDRIIEPGEFYSRTALLAESKRIVDILQNNGYYQGMLDTNEGVVVSKFFSTKPELKNRVNVALKFSGADRIFYFGKTQINIQDNKYGLRQSIIQEQLEFKEGEIFSREKIFQSEKNFSKLALVQNGRIEVDSLLNDDLLDLKVIITLQNKYEITPSISGVEIDGQFYLGGGIEYLNKNFLHHGGVLSLSLNGYFHSANVNRMEFINNFTQPFLWNNRVTFTLENRLGYYNIEKIQFFALKNLARFSYFISPHTFYQNSFVDFTIDILRVKYKQDELDENGNIITPAGTFTDELNSIVGLTVIHDRTNDLFNPSDGEYHAATIEQAGALAKLIVLLKGNYSYSQYIKFFSPNKYFYDLSAGELRNSILAAKFNIGEIFEYGTGERIIPIQNIYKFFSGGSNSLRGWGAKTNGMVPDPESGGKFLIDGSVEHRIRMFPNDQGFLKDLWTVYFVDYGNLWNSHRDFKLHEIALAVGVGARYYTFVGAIRVDLGFKLYNPRESEGGKWLFQKFNFSDKMAIQFGIGNAF